MVAALVAAGVSDFTRFAHPPPESQTSPHPSAPPTTNYLPRAPHPGGEKEWGWRGPSCQLQIARVLEEWNEQSARSRSVLL
ncbi:hypothetical protein J6590_072762 [Homalodisca vitripennis]|nr:hypothetical protein J6590_072762 [Homalodisca vitripennis]